MGKSLTVVREEPLVSDVASDVQRLLDAKAAVLADIAAAGSVAGEGEDKLVHVLKRYLRALSERVMTGYDAAAVWEAYATARNLATVTGSKIAATGKACKSQVSEVRALAFPAVVAVGPQFIDAVIDAKVSADRSAGEAVTIAASKAVYEASKRFRDLADTMGATSGNEQVALFTSDVDGELIARWIAKASKIKKSPYQEAIDKLADIRRMLVGGEKSVGICQEMGDLIAGKASDLDASVGGFIDLLIAENNRLAAEYQARAFAAANPVAK